MRVLCPSKWCAPLVAAAVFCGWISPGFAADPDSLAEEQLEKKGRRVVITDGKIVIDSETVLEIDQEDIEEQIEEALERAEDMIQEIEEKDFEYRKVQRSDIVRVGEDIYIDSDEVVYGDVVGIFGNVTIEGKVTGDVVSVFGGLTLGEDAVVNGEAVSVFGSLNKADGAYVRGQSVNVGPGVFCGKVITGPCGWGFPRVWWMMVSLGGLAILLLVALLISAIFREGTGRLSRVIRRDFLKSWLIGLLTEVILVVVTIVLAITLIGIPIAVLLWLVAGLAFLFSFAGVSLGLGEAISGAGREARSQVGMVFIGGILILAVPILARLLGGAGLFVPAMGIWLLGGLITWLALATGLGAVVMTRFGTRESNGKAQPQTAPPPAPEPQAQQG